MPIRDWATTFEPFTLQHGVCVGACAAVMVGAVRLGRRARRHGAEGGHHAAGTMPRAGASGSVNDRWGGDRVGMAIGWLGIVYWIASNLWWNWPGRFELARSLPIQVCDLAGLIGPLALLTRHRSLRAVTYFWGIALSSQGFVQPVLRVGWEFTEFWLFWANHTLVVGIAVYDVAARGFRPGWREYVIAAGWLLAYFALIMPVNLMWGLNYGYVGNSSPENPTVIDKLGAWPMRLVPLGLIALGVMALIEVPWAVRRRFGAKMHE